MTASPSSRTNAARWATFDCYGTLIDWNLGIRTQLERLFGVEQAPRLLERYHELEPELEADGKLSYREVLTEAMRRLGAPAGEEDALAQSLPSWQPFPEVSASLAELRRRGWRIGILSNTDPDYLDASLGHIGVPVDLRVVASEIGSYKPAPGHWDTFFDRTGADRSHHIHVAASLFHDVEPCARMGIPCVWIDREAELTSLPMAARLRDLTDLPDTLDRLVPA